MHAEEKEWKERFKEVFRKEQEVASLADTLAAKLEASEVSLQLHLPACCTYI